MNPFCIWQFLRRICYYVVNIHVYLDNSRQWYGFSKNICCIECGDWLSLIKSSLGFFAWTKFSRWCCAFLQHPRNWQWLWRALSLVLLFWPSVCISLMSTSPRSKLELKLGTILSENDWERSTVHPSSLFCLPSLYPCLLGYVGLILNFSMAQVWGQCDLRSGLRGDQRCNGCWLNCRERDSMALTELW